MKNLYRSLGVISLAFVSILLVPHSSQAVFSILAQVNASNIKVSNTGSVYTISFAIGNGPGIQTNVKYGIRLIPFAGTNPDMTVTADEKVYDESLNLLPSTSVNRSVTYTVPPSLTGKYEMLLVGKNENGVPLFSTFIALVNLNSSSGSSTVAATGIFIDPNSCYLTVSTDKVVTKYTLDQGVDILPSESLKLICTASNNTKDAQQTNVQVQTHFRTNYGGLVPAGLIDQSISFASKESKKIVIELPKPTSPQAYNSVVSLMNAGQSLSNSITAHWVLRGLSATVQQISLNKKAYNAGDTAIVTFTWTPSADAFPNSRLGTSSILTQPMARINVCGVDSSLSLVADYSKPVLAKVLIASDCPSPNVLVAIYDGNTKLNQLSTTIKNPPLPKIITLVSVNSGLGVLISILALLIALILLVMVVRHHKDQKITHIITILIIGGASLTLVFTTSTNKAEAAYNFTGSDGNLYTCIGLPSDRIPSVYPSQVTFNMNDEINITATGNPGSYAAYNPSNPSPISGGLYCSYGPSHLQANVSLKVYYGAIADTNVSAAQKNPQSSSLTSGDFLSVFGSNANSNPFTVDGMIKIPVDAYQTSHSFIASVVLLKDNTTVLASSTYKTAVSGPKGWTNTAITVGAYKYSYGGNSYYCNISPVVIPVVVPSSAMYSSGDQIFLRPISHQTSIDNIVCSDGHNIAPQSRLYTTYSIPSVYPQVRVFSTFFTSGATAVDSGMVAPPNNNTQGNWVWGQFVNWGSFLVSATTTLAFNDSGGGDGNIAGTPIYQVNRISNPQLDSVIFNGPGGTITWNDPLNSKVTSYATVNLSDLEGDQTNSFVQGDTISLNSDFSVSVQMCGNGGKRYVHGHYQVLDSSGNIVVPLTEIGMVKDPSNRYLGYFTVSAGNTLKNPLNYGQYTMVVDYSVTPYASHAPVAGFTTGSDFPIGTVMIPFTVVAPPMNFQAAPSEACANNSTTGVNLTWADPLTVPLYKYYSTLSGVSNFSVSYSLSRSDGVHATVWPISAGTLSYNDQGVAKNTHYDYGLTPIISYNYRSCPFGWCNSTPVTTNLTGVTSSVTTANACNGAHASADLMVKYNGATLGQNTSNDYFDVDTVSSKYDISWTSQNTSSCTLRATGSKFDSASATTTVGGPLTDTLGSNMKVVYNLSCVGTNNDLASDRVTISAAPCFSTNCSGSGAITGTCTNAALANVSPITTNVPVVFSTSSISDSFSGGSGPYTYTFNFGGTGSSQNGSPNIFTYNTAGTYAPTVTIKDAQGNYSAPQMCGTVTVTNPIVSGLTLKARKNITDSDTDVVTMKEGETLYLKWHNGSSATLCALISAKPTGSTWAPALFDDLSQMDQDTPVQVANSTVKITQGDYSLHVTCIPQHASIFELIKSVYAATNINSNIVSVHVSKPSIREF